MSPNERGSVSGPGRALARRAFEAVSVVALALFVAALGIGEDLRRPLSGDERPHLLRQHGLGPGGALRAADDRGIRLLAAALLRRRLAGAAPSAIPTWRSGSPRRSASW